MNLAARSSGPRSAQLGALLLGLAVSACDVPAVLTAGMPLHLEDHLDAATVVGSDVPPDLPASVEWRFDEPQPEWKATPLWNPPFAAPTLTRTDEGLRVALTDRSRVPSGQLSGAIHVDLPDWDHRDWADVIIRARVDSTSSVSGFSLGLNLREGRGVATNFMFPFLFWGDNTAVVRDGTVRTYRLGIRPFQGPWRQMGLWFWTDGRPGSLEVPSGTIPSHGKT